MPSAERVQWAKVRTGTTAFAALLILGTLMFLLTGGTLLEPKSTIYLYMPDASGLNQDSPVRVDGITVGKVETVSLSGSNIPDRVVKVTMTVERDHLAVIPDDSTAEASADTMLGDKFVDISGGKSTAHLRPGSELIYKASPDLMKRLDVAQFQERIRTMDALLTELEQGRTPLGKFVQGDEMYRTILKRVADLNKGLRAAADAKSDLGNVLYTDELYRKAEALLRALDESIAKLQSGQGSMGQFLRDDAQYAQWRNSVQDLRKSLQGMRADSFFASDQQYAEWNRTVQSLIGMVDGFAANPTLATSATFDNLNGMAKELQSTVKEFRENPRKFLRLKVF
jgi:phospholipid/cholesterol/gamma-HCH transport system substrate-binding protein